MGLGPGQVEREYQTRTSRNIAPRDREPPQLRYDVHSARRRAGKLSMESLARNPCRGDIDRVRGSQGPRDVPGPVVFPLEGVLGDTIEPVGHLVYSSVVRVQGHPPAFRSEAKARWYLRQLEQPQSRAQLWERLSSSRRLVLVVLPSPGLALTEWATIPMQTSVGELLLLPVSPSHA